VDSVAWRSILVEMEGFVKILRIAGVQFKNVVYGDSRKLISQEHLGHLRVRFWNLDQEAEEPSGVHIGRMGLLFYPGAMAFFRHHGLWPETEMLPLFAGDSPDAFHPILAPKPHWRSVGFSVDGQMLIYYEIANVTGRSTAKFHLRTPNGEVHSLSNIASYDRPRAAFSPNGMRVALSVGDYYVEVLDRTTRKFLVRFRQSNEVQHFAFLSESTIAIAAGKTIRVWDVDQQREICKFPSFRKHVTTLAVSPDGRLLAAGGREGIVRVWESDTIREVGTYDWDIGEVNQIAFAPDGSTAAAAGEKGIAIWDVG